MTPLERTEDEIREQIDWTRTSDGTPTNRWSGMTYEQGVEDALLWALGDTDELPIESDPNDATD